MRKIEITRWWTAFGGLVLWFAYFFIQSDMTKANGRQYCADMEAAGEHCTYDYIPVFEVVFVPIVICLLAYPFARFAFSLYAPPVERRELGWRIAGVDVAESYPFPQIFAALGLLFSLSFSGLAIRVHIVGYDHLLDRLDAVVFWSDLCQLAA